MKKGLRVVSWIFVVTGVIWILQGINILPGSFMTGQMVWARNGVIILLFGWYGLKATK